jgi:three-Cys-motif partner protein
MRQFARLTYEGILVYNNQRGIFTTRHGKLHQARYAMKTKLEPRNTQTRVKHEILARYLDTWGGIIVNGLRRSRQKRDWHFVYVDCFSYVGRYSGEYEDVIQGRQTQPVYGSPVIGIRALDKLNAYARRVGIELKTNVVLIEKRPAYWKSLRETLQQLDFGQRVRETIDFSSLANGEIALVNKDCIDLSDNLVAYTTSGYTWAFYLLDPNGPSGIPHDFVKAIVQQERHDVMINFIYEDLLRKTGLCLRKDLGAQHQRLVDYWTLAFGSERWIEIARKTLLEAEDHRYWRDSVLEGISLDDMAPDSLLTDEQLAQLKERKFVSAYRDVLQTMDPELAIKLVDLRFSDKERTIFYLFLTTHDATGALSLNKILYDAKYLEFELRYRLGIAKRTAPPPGQLPLLTVEPTVPKPIASPRPVVEEIAEVILRKLAGRTVNRRQVYRALVEEFFFPDEVDKALSLLKDSRRADFDGKLTNSTEIRFSNF